MKFAKFTMASAFFVPCVVWGAGNADFQSAAQLLSAARRGDIQSVQNLINSGANVNYVDSTGLSLVCTAVMNNDIRAIQVLQMYGADASDCERQIKNYKQKSRRAAQGEEYGFFSGLSSSQTLALSALGVAGVIGGVALLTDAFSLDGNNNSSSSSSGGHGSGGGGSSSATKSFTVPYGPAYLTSAGAIDTSYDLVGSLSTWDTGANASYFNYLKTSTTGTNFITDGLNSRLQNYLLMMGGYYSFASGYMGQKIFRNSSSNAPLLSENTHQKQPVRVALVTGNGINPAGSADFGNGIIYTTSTSSDAVETLVDKYVNNDLTVPTTGQYVHTEQAGFDLSGSGTVFNPYVNVNESALAKIVGGWEAGGSAISDLYGFVPNGQLAIYRTGNGYVWNTITNPLDRTLVGDFNDVDGDGKLSVDDIITIGTNDYTVETALSQPMLTDPTVTVNGVTYKLSKNSNLFVAKCVDTTNCDDFALYVGTDGAVYVNTSGGNDVDAVYTLTDNEIYTYKNKVASNYQNFDAMQLATLKSVDVIANTNILSVSRDNDYTTVGTFTKEAALNNVSNLTTFYSNKIDSIYGAGEGGVASNLFNNYNSSKPMLVMPAGEYLFVNSSAPSNHLMTEAATFENYAPLLYGNNLKHNFMTVIAVAHDEGTTDAATITGYGDGTSSTYGKLNLSIWYDSDNNIYQSRKCGLAGTGAGSVDPWCFAAAGPTTEMATASAAGAVASVKAAFDYMTNAQVFTLLALTADGPYLGADDNGLSYTTDTLAAYLQQMYDLPGEYIVSSMTSAEYLAAFKDVYGYGLINLERAIMPGKSVYYYTDGQIVASNGNAYWRSGSTMSRGSNILSLTGRGAITNSFYDVVQSVDGDLSLPRVWNGAIASDDSTRHGLYMGDLLGEFNVDSNVAKNQRIGDFEFSMSMSAREYNDNMNGLDNLRVAFVGNDFDMAAEYQRYLTDGESRFDGRANGLLALASNSISSDAAYKFGGFSFGVRAFNGTVTDETLLEYDPVVSSQFEPGRLGFISGGAFNTKYSDDKFAFGLSVGMMNETNTVLGMYSGGLLYMNGGKTQYVDAVATYKPMDNVKLSMRGTFANTSVDEFGGMITSVSDIKSNAFSFGLDIGGFALTVAAPVAVVDGSMGYGYAEFNVVENDNGYEIAMNNAHTEYVDLSAQNREFRFTSSYKKQIGVMTDGGVEFMYRVNPNNTNAFGNESILMFKVHHHVGI